MSESQPNLADFLLAHCTYISHSDIANLSTPTLQISEANRCAICLSTLSSIDSNIIQVNSDLCHHIFDADCLSRYILSGFNTCPLCRRTWFRSEDVVAHQLAAQAQIQELEFILDQFLILMRLNGFDADEQPAELSVEDGEVSGVEMRGQRRSQSALELGLSGVVEVRTRRGDRDVVQEWSRRQAGTSEDARFFDWTASDGETLVGDSDSGEW